MKEIKDRISEALKAKGKTPKELSDLTGIPIDKYFLNCIMKVQRYEKAHYQFFVFLLAHVGA